MKSTILALMVVGAATSAFGNYAYSEMIRMSDVIAVIDVTEITPTETKGTSWTYRQKISAKVIEVVKGSVERTLTIYGLEDFICAQCRFQKGRQLVFLKHDRDLLVGSNWHLSIRPIAGERCEWFRDSASIQLVPASLPTVIKQVKAEIEKQKGIEPRGAANGSQPVRSATNATSSAAGVTARQTPSKFDSRIPPPDLSKYKDVRDAKDWQNPYLVVRAEGVEVISKSNSVERQIVSCDNWHPF